MEIIPSNLEPSPLNLESDISDFDCGDNDLNEFLREDALEYKEQNLAQTMLLYYENKLVGYYTIACDAIFLALEEKQRFRRSKQLSAYASLKLARMAFAKDYQNQGCGSYILEVLKGFIYKLNKDGVGCRFITVDAYPNRVKFYLDRGFKANEHRTYKKKNHPSLRYDVWSYSQSKPAEAENNKFG